MRQPVIVLALGLFVSGTQAIAEKPTPASASIAYLCVGKHSTGFKFDKESKDWEPTVFKEGRRYVLKRNASKWSWADFGTEGGSPCDAPDKRGFIECSDPFTNVIMNARTLRYTLVARHGYVQFPSEKFNPGSTAVEGSQAPYIEIGECSKIDG